MSVYFFARGNISRKFRSWIKEKDFSRILERKVTETMTQTQNGFFYKGAIIFLALGFSFLHMYHVSSLFENDRHFSHLSNLEREMTFRTEMGFYYYFYKTVVNSDSIKDSFYGLLHDNKTEYPTYINALKRFNLYPEFVIGTSFKIFDSVTKYFGIKTKQCWQVDRGAYLPPVESCEGIGDPAYFYLEFVWLCAGISKALLFLYAVLLSDSLSGGLLTILSFLYNHSHCTRVQWTPPLRESFAYPFILLQMLTVSYCLKKYFAGKGPTVTQAVCIMVSTSLSLILWQFSQFVIATQTLSILLLFCVGLIGRNVTLVILFAQLMGLIQAAVALFGNRLLLQSFLFSLTMASVTVTSTLFAFDCGLRIPIFSFRGILVFGAVIGLALPFKFGINHLLGDYDAHIIDILRSKMSDFKNFHTQLYVCSPEFDFLPASTIYDLTKTALLPIVIVVIILITCKWGKDICQSKNNYMRILKGIEPDIAYNVLQLGAFTIMALLIMRLKLFWTPHMCLIASLVMSPKYLPARNNSRFALLAVIIALMSYEGIANVTKQRNIIGEYSNAPFEEVLNWINSETKVTDVFAGPMSIMANVLLSTGRNIVNHPHYEHPRIRDRTMSVYSIFSRQSAEEVYSRLISMGVNYVILDESWCFPRHRENCSMVDLWDITDRKNMNQEALCPKLFSGDSAPFVRAFSNDIYVILSLKVREVVEVTPQQYQI